MTQNQYKYLLSSLGEFFSQFSSPDQEAIDHPLNASFYDSFLEMIRTESQYNPWFTEHFVRYALDGLSAMLKPESIDQWLQMYDFPNSPAKRVAVIMAGNIPMVGFHDFITVLVSGHYFLGKASGKDQRLLKKVGEMLQFLQPEIKERIAWYDERISDFDAIIATGSNNTSRYFDYYFGKYPNIIRKNRNSVAVLSGDESPEDLSALGEDIFAYFGLGCRNVAKLFVPEDYDFDAFFKAIQSYQHLYDHNKYANNVDYYRSVFLLNQMPHLDNGFLILREDASVYSPVGVLHYQKYKDTEDINALLSFQQADIQCVVGAGDRRIPFGKAQKPALWDYADNVDTMEFLIKI